MAFPNYPATLYIDAAGVELRARVFACLTEIIFSAPPLSASRCELATNSRFSKKLCPQENKYFKFFPLVEEQYRMVLA
jgi:hypothetical protein